MGKAHREDFHLVKRSRVRRDVYYWRTWVTDPATGDEIRTTLKSTGETSRGRACEKAKVDYQRLMAKRRAAQLGEPRPGHDFRTIRGELVAL